MPSPFPGMDPYLEAPDVWPDFHDRLAGEISAVLNQTLPRPYYARLEMRPEVGIVGEEPSRRIVPDVAVIKLRGPAARDAAVAVVDEPRTDISPSVRMKVPNELLRHHFVEIRDSSRGHTLVTLIEIVSPSNKRLGADRRAYEAKQQEIQHSDTSLIELDLLRDGEPLVGGPAIVEMARQLDPRPDYVIAVDRTWMRGAESDLELFPVRLEDSLPCIPVPLRKGEAEVPLDVQYVFRRAYDGGPYARGAVDYDAAPDPPLRPELTEWLAGCLSRGTQPDQSHH